MGTFVVGFPKGKNYVIGYKIIEKLLNENNTVYIITSNDARLSFEDEMQVEFKRAFDDLNVLPGTVVYEDISDNNSQLINNISSVDGFIISSFDNKYKELDSPFNLQDFVINSCFETNKKVVLIYNKNNFNTFDLYKMHDFSTKGALIYTWSLDFMSKDAIINIHLRNFVSSILDNFTINTPINKEWDPSCE